MATLSTLLRYEMLFLLATLAVIVFYRLLTGQINMDGLLTDKAPHSRVPNHNRVTNVDSVSRSNSEIRNDKEPKTQRGVISAGRIQMLVATLLLTIYIVTKVLKTNEFPDIPREYLWALGGSHGLYLAGKVFSMLTEKLEGAAGRMVKRSKTVNGRMDK